MKARTMALAMACAMSACNAQTATQTTNVAPAMESPPPMDDREATNSQRTPAWNEVVSKSFPGDRPLTVAVLYRSRQGDQNPECELTISEGTDAKVVARTRNMIDCVLLEERDAVEMGISQQQDQLVITQQKGKGNTSYWLERNLSGEWVVRRAEFVYPGDDVGSQEVLVVKEVADLSRSDKPILVEDYQYNAVEPFLIRSTIE